MKITEKIILKYHLGTCTEAERQAVEQWLEDGEETSRAPAFLEKENVEEIWDTLSSQINKNNSRQFQQLKWAASFILVCGMSYLFYIGLFNGIIATDIKFGVATGKQGSVTLDDGSYVQLNSTTQLKYPSRFSFFSREVELQYGEAFFSIAKEAKRPFILHIGDTKISVLGTKFNVESQRDSDELIVTLTEGSIRFNAADKELLMRPGEQLIYHKVTGNIKLISAVNASLATSWTTGNLWYDDAPITEILGDLERRFGVKFINNVQEERRFTGKFNQETLQEIIGHLSGSAGLTFRKKPTGIEVSILPKTNTKP